MNCFVSMIINIRFAGVKQRVWGIINLGNNKTLSISPDLSLVNDYSKPNTSSSQASYGVKIKLAF